MTIVPYINEIPINKNNWLDYNKLYKVIQSDTKAHASITDIIIDSNRSVSLCLMPTDRLQTANRINSVDPPTGDLPGQRPQLLGHANTVPEADGGVRRLVRAGGAVGVLPAVPQQVQPGGAVLVESGAEMGWSAPDVSGRHPELRPPDDLEGTDSNGRPLGG